LPDDRPSRVLSVAWRLDTLAGCWLAGFVPTGAKDPYALRRHVLAILRLVRDLEARVDLGDLVARALEPYRGERGDAAVDTARQQILAFIGVRLEGWLTENEGADAHLVRAVLPVRGHDPTDAAAWIQALDRFRGREDFLLLATGFKRCTNILKGDVLAADQRAAARSRWQEGGRGAQGEDFGGLTEPAEQALRQTIAAAVPGLLTAEEAGDYAAVFQALSGFGPVIDRFFDEVRVNAEDPRLRQLRQAFLREIHALFLLYADFSRILPDED
jgi:glycyl-tRNA synthetase beta chain